MEEFGLEKLSLIHFAGLINIKENNKLFKKWKRYFQKNQVQHYNLTCIEIL